MIKFWTNTWELDCNVDKCRHIEMDLVLETGALTMYNVNNNHLIVHISLNSCDSSLRVWKHVTFTCDKYLLQKMFFLISTPPQIQKALTLIWIKSQGQIYFVTFVSGSQKRYTVKIKIGFSFGILGKLTKNIFDKCFYIIFDLIFRLENLFKSLKKFFIKNFAKYL